MSSFSAELIDYILGKLLTDAELAAQEFIKAKLTSLKPAMECEVARLSNKYLDALIALHPTPHFTLGDEDSPPEETLRQQESFKKSFPSSTASSAATSTAESAGQPPRIELATGDDTAVLDDLLAGRMKHRDLESHYPPHQSVRIRRAYIESISKRSLRNLPHTNYDYTWVNGACCENIIGYMPVPTGIAGPLRVNGKLLYIPMSTTEGALIASTNRGCRALNECADESAGHGGGVTAITTNDGMTRAPVLRFSRVKEAVDCMRWLEKESNFVALRTAFEGTSRFARLRRVSPHLSGNLLYLRFVATTGDAMGMNMVTKGTTEAVRLLQRHFPRAKLESISGNMCVDKKASAINWIQGRGKSVVADAEISGRVVRDVLKTSVRDMVQLAGIKLQIGSTNSICIGGSNAHAANIVAAMFLATGQDAAQVVSSSMCTTQLQETEEGNLHISCTMNSLEVGTVGGGTILEPQQTCLELLGCCGPSRGTSGENAKHLAEVICSTVLAGELSLLASQCTGDLVRSHLRLNRSNRDLASSTYSLNPLPGLDEKTALEGDLTNFKMLGFKPSYSRPVQERGAPKSISRLVRKVREAPKSTNCSPL